MDATPVGVPGQGTTGIRQRDFREDLLILAEIFFRRCGNGRYRKHQAGCVETAARQTVRRMEGREAGCGADGYAETTDAKLILVDRQSAADDAGVLLDGVGAVYA